MVNDDGPQLHSTNSEVDSDYPGYGSQQDSEEGIERYETDDSEAAPQEDDNNGLSDDDAQDILRN